MTGGYDPDVLRSGLRKVRFARVFRVVHRDHRSAPLAASPVPSRFSDPRGRFAVLYASEAVRCAFWETLGRNRFARRRRREIPRAEIEARLVVSIRSTGPLVLIDLRGDGPVRIGAPSAVAHDGNHAAGRALSAAVHAGVPEADGFLFPSRFTGDTCVAVFERAFGRLEALDIADLVRHRIPGRPRRLRHRADGTAAGAVTKRREMPARGRCDLAGQGLAAKDARSFGVMLPASVRNAGVLLQGR